MNPAVQKNQEATASPSLQISRSFYASIAYSCSHPTLNSKENSNYYGEHFSTEVIGSNSTVTLFFTHNASTFWKENLNNEIQNLKLSIDHYFLNELEFFKTNPPTPENIAKYLWQKVSAEYQKNLVKIKITSPLSKEENIEYYGDNKIIWTTSHSLSIGHRHYKDNFSLQKNEELFKECVRYHGHSFLLLVSLTGTLNSFGTCVKREFLLKKIDLVLSSYKETWLNSSFTITSGEILCFEWRKQLEARLERPVNLQVQETRKNSFFSNSTDTTT